MYLRSGTGTGAQVHRGSVQAGTSAGAVCTVRCAGHQHAHLHLSLSVPVCPCLSLSVPVCPCLSQSVPVCPCMSLPFPVCPCLSLYVPVCQCPTGHEETKIKQNNVGVISARDNAKMV